MNDLMAAVAAAVEARRDDLTGWITDLVRIPSVTGNEDAAQIHIAALMAELGLEVDVFVPSADELRAHPSYSDDGLPVGRPVVIGHRAGAAAGAPSLILNGHVDVVPAGDETLYPEGAWSGRVTGGELWGRGACDMKAGLLSGLAAMAALHDLGVEVPGDVMLQSVTGEETGGVGTLAAVLRGYRADAAVVLEPTRLAVCPVGAGAASFRLHVHGKAAHGATRREGISAVAKFAPLHAALEQLEARRHEGWSHPAYPEGTLVAPISVGRVTAGDWPSTVPELLVAEGRYGVRPGETLAAARAELEEALATAAAADPWLRDNPPVVEWFEGQFAPAETPTEHPFVRVLSEVHQSAAGRAPLTHGVTYGSDLRLFTNDAAMAAVLYGPGDVRLAHTVDERVPLDEVVQAATVVAQLILRWGGAA